MKFNWEQKNTVNNNWCFNIYNFNTLLFYIFKYEINNFIYY